MVPLIRGLPNRPHLTFPFLPGSPRLKNKPLIHHPLGNFPEQTTVPKCFYTAQTVPWVCKHCIYTSWYRGQWRSVSKLYCVHGIPLLACVFLSTYTLCSSCVERRCWEIQTLKRSYNGRLEALGNQYQKKIKICLSEAPGGIQGKQTRWIAVLLREGWLQKVMKGFVKTL